MTLHGNIGALRQLSARVREISAAGFRGQLGARLGATAMKLVADEFRQSRDPYGAPWAPLVLRRGQPLRDTGRMQASVNYQPTSTGFRLIIPVVYASTHQRGATIVPRAARALRFKAAGRFFTLRVARIPRRQIVPEQATGGLGPIWTAAFNREAERLLSERLRIVA